VVTDCDELIGPDIVTVFQEEGAEVLADRRDLTSPTAAAALIAEAGRVDVLVANLAVRVSGHLAVDSDDAELDLMLDRLVRPLHRLTRAVLPQMIARRQGKIVVVGAGAAIRGVPRRAVYAAARAAQHGYVRTVGVEVASHNVQVNATAQTFVENPTYFAPEYQATEEFRRRIAEVPAGRLATGREASRFLLTLAGSESDFLFGQIFPFTGGWIH
jgi:2-keto-3-deoxy-L-fuconate dehydrogenase